MKKLLRIAVIIPGLVLSACTPEFGSEAWCEQLREKSKGEWTANEIKGYARHCLFE